MQLSNSCETLFLPLSPSPCNQAFFYKRLLVRPQSVRLLSRHYVAVQPPLEKMGSFSQASLGHVLPLNISLVSQQLFFLLLVPCKPSSQIRSLSVCHKAVLGLFIRASGSAVKHLSVLGKKARSMDFFVGYLVEIHNYPAFSQVPGTSYHSEVLWRL